MSLFLHSLFAAAFMFDVELVTIKSVHQPNTNQFIDSICERLQQVIEIDDGDTKQRLNFVKTGKNKSISSFFLILKYL